MVALRLTQIAALSAIMVFGSADFASAADQAPQLAAAELVTGFPASAGLGEEALGSVSGFGVGQQSVPTAGKRQDISVILFDELGQPKGGKISSGSGTASVVTKRVSVGGGR
jgi:hypothetical protein